MHTHVFRRALCALTLTALSCIPLIAIADDAPDQAEIVVTATRQQQRANELLSDVTVLERQAIEQAGHSSLIEVLAAQPGIQTGTTGGAGAGGSLYIRGTSAGHALVLVDGVRIGSATAGAAALENIPASQIERIEILRGPASAVYGSDAIGGVVQIFTRRGQGTPHADALIGLGSRSTQQAQAGVSGANEQLRFSLRAGYEHTNGIDQLSNPHDRDAFRQTHASGRLALTLPKQGELSASFLTARGLSHYDAGVPLDSRLRKRGDVAGVRWRQPLAEAWTSTLEAGTSLDDLTAIDSGFDSQVRTRRKQYAWLNDIKLPVGQALLGIERVEEAVSNSVTTYSEDRRRTNSLLAGWNGHFGAHRLQASLRQDSSTQFGRQRTGSLAYGYQFNDAWRAHASAGTAFKAPTFNDLYFPLACIPPWGCFGGNPDLRPEKARNHEIGLDWETENRRASLVVYDNRVKDLIVWAMQPFNVGTALLRGATLSYGWTQGDWEGGASYDWLRARDADTGEQLVRRARQQFAAHVARRIGDWRLGAEWLVVGSRPDTDAGRRVRLGGYGLVNAFVHYQFQRDWRLELRGNNLGDKHYRQAAHFNTPGASAFIALRYEPK